MDLQRFAYDGKHAVKRRGEDGNEAAAKPASPTSKRAAPLRSSSPTAEASPSPPPQSPPRESPPPSQQPDWPGPLPPLLINGLQIVFVGFNPGTESARTGHYYAHASNRFWKYLFWSGFTPRMYESTDDNTMPEKHRIGFTDLVARSTRGITELSRDEMRAGSITLEERIEPFQPRCVCFVGKGIWEAVARARGWNLRTFQYGLDLEHTFAGTMLCCVPSTSGLNSMAKEKQLAVWKDVRAVVHKAKPKSSEPKERDNSNSNSNSKRKKKH